ncbi:MAG: MarR family transcriptional regulator [Candidatus Limnocylindrales bacterium]
MNVPNRDLREIVREEPVMRPRILAELRDGPRTVPEIATAIACPTHEVVLWVMGMRRYGYVREVKGATDGGYFRYETTEKVPA